MDPRGQRVLGDRGQGDREPQPLDVDPGADARLRGLDGLERDRHAAAAAGFRFTTDELFWLAALPALSGATLRIFYSFMVPIFGGRRFTVISTARC